ncbi:MAG: hypothetical protein K5869_10495 [Saccharofermentans sp.]|nr:hypothetical protein [Saccharofermentans sp.]
MAKVVCPDCGKEVDPSEGFCVYCGYTFDDGQTKSPFASAYNQNQGAEQFEETSGGAPVLRFDGSSVNTMPLSSSRGGSELMFGIGMCRILAIFFAALVIVSMLLPFVSMRIVIPKSSIPAGADASTLVRSAAEKDFKYKDDGKQITISRNVSLISMVNRYVILMIGACVAGIVFAIKGKPAVYLICGIGGALLGLFNYFINFSSIDVITKSALFARLYKAMEKTGITFNIDKGAGAYLLIIAAVGMIVSAIFFVYNHAAYDD